MIDTTIANNFTNVAGRPLKDRMPFVLKDHTDAIRAWHKADRKADAPIGHLVEEQQLLFAELLDGLRQPRSGPLAEIVAVSLELLKTPDFATAIQLGWSATQLFGLDLRDPENLHGMGMAGFLLYRCEGIVPEGTDWHWNAVTITLAERGRVTTCPLITDHSVPIWQHPRFRVALH
jgi:hypothetical protein